MRQEEPAEFSDVSGGDKELRKHAVAGLISIAPTQLLKYSAGVHRASHLENLDQAEMLGIRAAWYEEVGGPPTGNKCAWSRALFQ